MTTIAVGDEVRIKGCPHVWTVYAAWSLSALHLQRWDDTAERLVRETFVSPAMLVRL
jgi:hypothetical protein